MPRGKIDLDMRTCAELRLSVTVWCAGCNRGIQLPPQPQGPKVVELFERLRCTRCGAQVRSLTVEHSRSQGGLAAGVLRLERESPATSR